MNTWTSKFYLLRLVCTATTFSVVDNTYIRGGARASTIDGVGHELIYMLYYSKYSMLQDGLRIFRVCIVGEGRGVQWGAVCHDGDGTQGGQ